ncbi:MAG: ATP-binding cassette domain-containing protein [Acidimicrobiia bacterium]|nr:ATP-binding cassette domain-containing protein [Acidimicrobiia bacterium]
MTSPAPWSQTTNERHLIPRLAPDGSPVVSARDVAAAYGTTTVWAGATFDVAPGEFVAVLGPNGAGKSTLFRLLLGLLRPAAGSLAVLGGPPHRGNPAIGYVPQRRPIDPDMQLAAVEYVKLGVTGHRWGPGWPRNRPEVAGHIAAAVAAVGAQAFVTHPVGTLSGGELQRLMLAQAIVNDPHLLLLDEPLANLDVRNQVAVAGLVADLAKARGMAVLLVAHDVNPLLPALDRVMYVAAGRVSIGAPDEVITSEHLSALYDANVEVLRDSRGRLFVVGLDDEASHPHDRASRGGGHNDQC